jgi:hypothetical protein
MGQPETPVSHTIGVTVTVAGSDDGQCDCPSLSSIGKAKTSFI